MILKVLQKDSWFFYDTFILTFEKLGLVGPVKLKIKLVWT